MTSSSSSFDRYHEEFNMLIQQMMMIENSKEDAIKSKDGKSIAANDANNNTLIQQQCNDLIKQMSLEARSAAGDADQKQQMLDTIKECKTQYRHVVQQSDRQGLLAGASTISSNGGSSSAACLQKNEATMVAQNANLERAHRSIQETEQVAMNITQELDKNRETISRTHDHIHQVSTLTSIATSILNRLKK